MKREIVETGGFRIPVAIAEPQGPVGVVIVGHGLGVSKEHQIPEIERLARAGYVGLVYDAPHHGDRRDSLLDVMNQVDEVHRHDLYLSILAEASREMPHLVDHCRNRWKLPTGVSGVSMGGFLAFSSVLSDPQPDFCISIIGSPDWYTYSVKVKPEEFVCPRHSPCEFPGRFRDLRVLALTAGLDQVVLPGPAADFVRNLKRGFPEKADNFTHKEYPHSEHFMRSQDWDDAWSTIVSWLDSNYRTQPGKGS